MRLASTARKFNKYDLTGDYGIGYTYNTNEPFYFDLEDYEKIKFWTWQARHDVRKGREYSKYYIEAFKSFPTNEFYKNSKKRKYRQKRIHLHHLVMGYNDLVDNNVPVIDHVNRKTFDCRKENLREATIRENNINKDKQVSNTSGIVGVSYDNRSKKWLARICDKNNHRINICKSERKEEAIVARLVAEVYYYKENAPQKHLFEKYGITEDFVEDYLKKGFIRARTESEVMGVYKRNGALGVKWYAVINYKGKQRCIGTFCSKEEAVYARLLEEKKYLPEHRQQRHLWKEYGIE